MERPSIIQQLRTRTFKSFGHHPWQRKRRNKPCSSPLVPVHFEVDVSHENLENMSELDTTHISGLSQDLSRSESPSCVESSPTSSVPQNEKRENESKPTLSEDMCSTQDNVLDDDDMESYTENIQIQPVDSRISSLRQSEPICKFHWIAAFSDEVSFQTPAEGPSAERPELQSTMYTYAKDSTVTQDSFKEKNSVAASISTAKDHLAHEYVTQSSRGPSHYNEETLQCMEKPLATCTAVGSILKPNQPQNFLYKESVSRNGEDPCYSGNSFNLHDLRLHYKTEETEVASKEIQISEESPEILASHREEVLVEDLESPRTGSTWGPAGVCRSAEASRETCVMPDTEQSFESFQLLEEDMALNEALQRLQHTNREQQMQIQDLQCSNLHLQKKNKELQMKILKQPLFFDIINKLEKNMEELIEDKYNMKLEKNDMNRKLQNLQEILAITEKHLQESRKEKETLQLEAKKIKADYILLQEKYMTEVQQKNRSVSQCIEMDRSLIEKEGEVERLQHLKGELERATTSALDLLQREKETREQEFLSLQEEFQKREKENLKERQKLKLRVEKLIAQVKNLLHMCENEKAKNRKLQQQINEVKNVNAQLQEQVTRNKEQNYVLNVEIAQIEEKLDEGMEPDIAKDITFPHAEHFRESEKLSEVMLQKLKSLHVKKKDFDKEIANFDSDEAKKVKDVPILLGVKLDEYHILNEELDSVIKKLGSLVESKDHHCHKLIEENDTYQRQLGCLISKVASYEEIIKCADQRLEGSHSQIVHLEERNKYLEDLIRRPPDRARKLRTRSENHPKSMTSNILFPLQDVFLLSEQVGRFFLPPANFKKTIIPKSPPRI
ncbi:PREDICTED: cancer-associated gene 1 protein isoform X3 [Chinchilla lanigera]|uniref:Cancer antigen 1 n=1 Tax=Chinchilla lanigera TaxID=34839 RepID=A0A8C2UUK2_CHILA|nr:PREDICTED: cancer-associated gene 1 protein isoform X3 [Chinchilla lanigera]